MHSKGDRLDLAVGTSFVLDYIAYIGILSSYEGVAFDHVSCFIDLDNNTSHKNKEAMKMLHKDLPPNKENTFYIIIHL